MIHETAVVEPGVELGVDVDVGPFAYLADGARVGDGCIIGPRVTVLSHTELGAGCRVHAGAVIGDLPQDLGFEGSETFVKVGPGCQIREGVTIHRGTKEGTTTEIGEGCFLMAYSHFAHNVKLGDHVIVANAANLGGYVEVGSRAFISGNVSIHQFVRIGRLVMLGGNCGVSKDVPPFCTLRSCELNRVGGLNVVGMKRAGMGPEERREAKEVFKILFRSGLNAVQAKAALAERFVDGVGREFVDFLEQSERGLCSIAGS